MKNTTRRTFLISTGVIAVAGCLDTGERGVDRNGGGGGDSNGGNRNTPTERPDRDNDGVPDGEDDYPSDSERSVEVNSIDQIVTVKEDEWRGWELSFPSATHIEFQFTVRDGPPVDFFLASNDEYQYFQNGERFRTFDEVSAMDSIGDDGSGWIDSGDYVIVIDNSEYGVAEPPTNLDEDPADVELSVVLSR